MPHYFKAVIAQCDFRHKSIRYYKPEVTKVTACTLWDFTLMENFCQYYFYCLGFLMLNEAFNFNQKRSTKM